MAASFLHSLHLPLLGVWETFCIRQGVLARRGHRVHKSNTLHKPMETMGYCTDLLLLYWEEPNTKPYTQRERKLDWTGKWNGSELKETGEAVHSREYGKVPNLVMYYSLSKDFFQKGKNTEKRMNTWSKQNRNICSKVSLISHTYLATESNTTKV